MSVAAQPLMRATARTPRIVWWYASLTRAKALASCRHRIGNLAEAAQRARVVIAEELPEAALMGADALIVVRPYPTPAVLRALDRARDARVLRIADYDDLLFAGDPAERPEVKGGRLSLAWMVDAQRAYAALLPRFDAYTVTTDELAEELLAACPTARVHVVPNVVSRAWVEQGRALYRAFAPGDRRVMRFFPGSPTHDESFALARPALAAWMHAHPEVELEIVGNLDWDASGFPASRVRRRAAVAYDALPELLASSWVSLWPRSGSRFDRCKSPIKFLEAAAFGCPTVASAACARPGLACEGLVHAASPDAWGAALTRWLDDELRMRAGEAAMRFVDRHARAEDSVAVLTSAITAMRGAR